MNAQLNTYHDFSYITQMRVPPEVYLNIVFCNRRQEAIMPDDEQRYIINALKWFYWSCIEFRELIQMSRMTRHNCNYDIKVWCCTHISKTDKYPHFNLTIKTSFGAINSHVYWNIKRNYPLIYTITHSFDTINKR